MRSLLLLLALLVGCATAPRGPGFVERHVYPCRDGVCQADDSQLAAREGLRRALSHRADLCRAGTVGYEDCEACMGEVRDAMARAGLAPHVEDLFEDNRRCW